MSRTKAPQKRPTPKPAAAAPRAKRVSIQIDADVHGELSAMAKQSGQSESKLASSLLRKHIAAKRKPETVYDIAKRLGAIGIVKGGPRDRSTNRKYMEGFGE